MRRLHLSGNGDRLEWPAASLLDHDQQISLKDRTIPLL
jgi:hypothetical protein